jgi:uncharacterized protein (TIGR02996 family)
MFNDRGAWLSAIRGNPDDDALRLAFADWLEGQNEPDFASFIRVEIQRDRLPKGDSRRTPLHEQAKALRRCLPADMRAAGLFTTRRGLPVWVESGVFALRDGIGRLGPYTTQLGVLLGGNGTAEQEAEEELAGGGTDRLGAALADLFASPWVRQWVELQTHYVRLTQQRVRWMTEPGNLTELEALAISDGADDGAVRALSEAKLPRLKILGIDEVRRRAGWDDPLLTPAAVHALIDSPLLDQLEGLYLGGDWLGNDELQSLAESPRVVGLKSLYPWPRQDSVAGLRALVNSPHLGGLTHLNLSRIALDPQIVSFLAQRDVLPSLRKLDINFEDAWYRDVLLPRFGDGLLVGSIEDSQGEPENDRRASQLRIPYYECSIFLPAVVAEEYVPLTNRVISAVEAALRTHDLGGKVYSHIAGPGSHDSYWQCGFDVYDIRQAVTLLRRVLLELGVQADARIDIRQRYSGIPLRSYPLAAQGKAEDWSDLAEVERSARRPQVRPVT